MNLSQFFKKSDKDQKAAVRESDPLYPYVKVERRQSPGQVYYTCIVAYNFNLVAFGEGSTERGALEKAKASILKEMQDRSEMINMVEAEIGRLGTRG